MTTDARTKQALIRMAWLCAELYHSNQFSRELLWKWHEEAAEALRHLNKQENIQ